MGEIIEDARRTGGVSLAVAHPDEAKLRKASASVADAMKLACPPGGDLSDKKAIYLIMLYVLRLME